MRLAEKNWTDSKAQETIRDGFLQLKEILMGSVGELLPCKG
jgi:hypothetical protein